MGDQQLVLKLTDSIQKLVKAIESANIATSGLRRGLNNTSGSFTNTNNQMRNFNKKIKEGGALTEALDGNWFQFGRKLILNSGPLGKATASIAALSWRIHSAVSEAFSLNQQFSGMADGLTFLSSAGNSTNLAFQAFGSSKGGFSQVTSALRALDQAGISNSSMMKELSSTYASLEQATGVAADTFSKFGGEMTHLFGTTTKETLAATSAFTAMGFTSGQLQETLEGASTALEKFGSLVRRSGKDAKQFSQGYAAGIKVLTEFGISAKKANEFVGKLLDPDQFQENIKLFGQLGISTDKYFAALESGKGAGEFIADAVGGLADLGTRLQGMNAQARFGIAKQLGIDPQLLASMAGKSSAEVKARLMEAQKAAQKENDAKEKEAKAKANAERIEMQFTMMKAKALAPVMRFVNQNMKTFFALYDAFAAFVSQFYNIIIRQVQPFITEGAGIISGIIQIFKDLSKAETFQEMFKIVGDRLGKVITMVLQSFGPGVVSFIKSLITSIAANAKSIIKPIFEALRDSMPAIFEGIRIIITELTTYFIQIFPSVIAAAFTIVGDILLSILKNLPIMLFNTFKELFKKGFSGFVGGLIMIGIIMRTVVSTYRSIAITLRALNRTLAQLKNIIGKGGAGGMMSGIGGMLKGGLYTMLFAAALDGIAAAMDTTFVGKITGKTEEQLRASGTVLEDRVAGFLGGFFQTLSFGMLDENSAFLKGISNNLAFFVMLFFRPLENLVSNFDYWAVQTTILIDNITSGFSEFFSTDFWFRNVIDPFYANLIDPIINGFENFINGIIDMFTDFEGFIENFSLRRILDDYILLPFNNMINFFRNLSFENILNGIVNSFNAFIESMLNIGKNLVNFFTNNSTVGKDLIREAMAAAESGDKATAIRKLDTIGFAKDSKEYKLYMERINDKLLKAQEEKEKQREKKREELAKDQLNTNKKAREFYDSKKTQDTQTLRVAFQTQSKIGFASI